VSVSDALRLALVLRNELGDQGFGAVITVSVAFSTATSSSATTSSLATKGLPA
jgi:hypothetical protein